MVGDEPPPDWLATDGLLAVFAKRRADARRRYIQSVAEGKCVDSIWIHLKNQEFLGDDPFLAKSLLRNLVNDDVSVPKAQGRAPSPSLEAIATRHRSRETAIIAAQATSGYSYQRIAEHLAMDFTSVGRMVRSVKVHLRG